MNKFQNKIFKEFEEDLYRCLDMSLDDYMTITGNTHEGLSTKFNEVLEKDGVRQLRLHMHQCISTLSIIFEEEKLGRQMTVEEMDQNAERLGLSITYN